MAKSTPPPTTETPTPEPEPSPSEQVPPAPSTEAPFDGRTAGFFDWMRRPGIVRGNGWIGGVCLGIADRIGVDVIIVRGIAVVLALIGAPAILLYALAWLLLPDTSNRIHLQELIRGRFEPAIVGIGLLILAAMLPVTQGVWWLGYSYWGAPYWDGGGIARAFWTIVALAAVAALIIWAAHRSNRLTVPPLGPVFDEQAAAAARDAAFAAATPAPATSESTSGSGASAAFVAGATISAPVEPPKPADAAEFEAWKTSHAEWKTQHDAWRKEQAASAKAIREQRAAESRAAAVANAKAAEARNQERLRTNPRVGGAFHATVIGLAIVAGALGALWAGADADLGDYQITIGLAIASLVLAFALVLAGVRGRRSGMLGVSAFVLITVTVATAFVPRTDDQMLFVGNVSPTGSTTYVHPFGSLAIDLDWISLNNNVTKPQVVAVQVGVGDVSIEFERELTVQIDAVLANGMVTTYTRTSAGDIVGESLSARGQVDGSDFFTTTLGDGSDPDVIVRITSRSGDVSAWDLSIPSTETEDNR